MIVTLTPNPSLDRTIAVEQLRVGEVHRAQRLHIDAGGKGVNVSRALAANGFDTVAVLPANGAPAVRVHRAARRRDGVPHDYIALEGAVRTNITLVEDDGTTTKINEPGRASTAADAAAMLDAVERHIDGRVVGGRLRQPAAGNRRQSSTWASSSGRALAACGSRSTPRAPPCARPWRQGPISIKPNHEELEEFVGQAARRPLGDVLEAARGLVEAGVGTVVVSLGEHGALAVDAQGAVHAIGRRRASRSRPSARATACLPAGWPPSRRAPR